MSEVRWIASVSASCFHAVAAMLRGEPLLDAALEQALADGVHELRSAIESVGADEQRFVGHLVALSGGIEHNPELAAILLRKTLGAGSFPHEQAHLARVFTALEQATLATHSGLLDELAAAGEPLERAWAQTGDGLLRRIGELTDPLLVPEAATVLLVTPATGQSQAHLAYNSVSLEVGRMDLPPHEPLIHLAWLLAQLNLDLPRFSERLEMPADAGRIGALALVPIALSAASEMGTTSCDADAIRAAASAWLPRAADEPLLAQLLSWWEVFRTSGLSWDVALAAWERMLLPQGEES